MEEKKNEIILFENQNVKLEVNLKDETVWLTQEQMSKLFKSIIVLVLALILISTCSHVFAAVNMNLGDDTSSINTSTTTSSTVTTSEFDLELTNILCIVLIVVGVLLRVTY